MVRESRLARNDVSLESGRTAAAVELNEVTVDHQAGGGRFSGRKAQSIRAVDNVSLTIPRGRTLGLVGGTGAGKSTIAQLVMGMLVPTSGTVRIDGVSTESLEGRDLLEHRQQVQIVMQDPYSSLDPRMRVGDIISEPLTMLRTSKRDRRARVDYLLDLVGLSKNKADLYPHQFSGGQRQRIAIARALAPSPQIIVLDEPTSALDVSVRAQILKLLEEIQEEFGVTYLVISHDLVSVAYLAHEVAVMFRGKIVEHGPTKALYTRSLHPYTQLLHESAPSADGKFMEIAAQPAASTSEDTHDAKDGCRYLPRCELFLSLGKPSRCQSEEPDLRCEAALNQDHTAACHFFPSERQDVPLETE